jgi:hypothetical protein
MTKTDEVRIRYENSSEEWNTYEKNINELRTTVRILELEKKKGTYEVCMTATLQEDSQGREQDGKSIKSVEQLITVKVKGGGERRDVQNLDSTARGRRVSPGKCRGKGKHITLHMSEPVKGIIFESCRRVMSKRPSLQSTRSSFIHAQSL